MKKEISWKDKEE